MNNLANRLIQTPTRAPLLIGVDMATGKDECVMRNIRKAKCLINKNEAQEQSVCNMVNAIMTLALLSRDVIHIETKFSPCSNSLDIKVFPFNTNYFGIYKPLFNDSLYLDKSSSLGHLKALEDLLIDFVAEAKDKAIGAV